MTRPYVLRGKLLVLLLGLLLLGAPCMASARSITFQQTPTASNIKVEVQEAAPKFPDTVDFTLRVKDFAAKRATLNFRPVGRTITSELEGDINSPAADITATLDLNTHYMPPGIEIEYYWSLLDAVGTRAETPVKTFMLLDERYNWQTVSDNKKGVSVHWYTETGQANNAKFGQNVLATATEALDRLQRDIGASLDHPANIWVYATQDALASALYQNNPEWVGGQPFPDLSIILVGIADDELAARETQRMVPHELSHLVLYHATRNPYNSPPLWLDEGMAVHNEEVHLPGQNDLLKTAASEGHLIPIKALSGSFGADDETARLSYAQAGSVVDFILGDARYGPKKLARTISAFQKGVTYDEALDTGLGTTVDELDQQWRASLPYKVAPQAAPSSQQPASQESQLASLLRSPFFLVPLTLCVVLFSAGGILTAIMLARKRAA